MTNSERLTTIKVLWHCVYEAHVQYQLASKSLSQWDHWRCHASLSIFWVELQYFAQLYMKRIDTLIKHGKSISCNFRWKDTSSACPCQMPQWWRMSERKKKIILMIKIWLTPKQRAVIVHCAFVFTFPQVFNHNIWHLSQGGLWCEWDGKSTCGSICGVCITVCLYMASCMCAYMTACTCILYVYINARMHLYVFFCWV